MFPQQIFPVAALVVSGWSPARARGAPIFRRHGMIATAGDGRRVEANG
jgi:hypothetical protein